MKIKERTQQRKRSERLAILQSMNIDFNKRFNWGSESWVQDYEYDLTLIEKDVDLNLKDDLAYIGHIREKYNLSGSDPEDQKMLATELSRMEKIYTHKINYLTIRSHLQNIKEKPWMELARLEKKYADEIRRLESEHARPIHFRDRTHAGYRMKVIRRADRLHDQKIKETKKAFEKEKEETIISIKQEEANLIKAIAGFLNIDQRYVSLIKAGITLLPGDSRLAGIFPKSHALSFNSDNKGHRHEVMQRQAHNLIMRHNLFAERETDTLSGTGILPKTRTGCVCIMYIKEGHMKESKGATFRPVFGTSGVKPYGEKYTLNEQQIEINSYTSMGLPNPSGPDISYEKTAADLSKHVDIMQRLGIKTPSLQSRLYFLQTPEYRANKIINEIKSRTEENDLIRQARQNRIGMLEKWGPSNCAEPAIMTAIYQMYSRPADIYLSVPFEGILSHGKLLLKYTCARCALSEPAFMSPVSSSAGQILTDMRLQKDRSPVISDHLLTAALIYNAEYRNHPYLDKRDAIIRTVTRNQGYGFGHVKRGHNQVAAETTITLMIK